MNFIPHIEIYPNYEDGISDDYNGTQKIATNSFLKDGNTLYLMGGTVLCKYDISDSSAPRLLNRADVAADHTGDPAIRTALRAARNFARASRYCTARRRRDSGALLRYERQKQLQPHGSTRAEARRDRLCAAASFVEKGRAIPDGSRAPDPLCKSRSG